MELWSFARSEVREFAANPVRPRVRRCCGYLSVGRVARAGGPRASAGVAQRSALFRSPPKYTYRTNGVVFSFQTRDLETKSRTRHNGRGPDSSLRSWSGTRSSAALAPAYGFYWHNSRGPDNSLKRQWIIIYSTIKPCG